MTPEPGAWRRGLPRRRESRGPGLPSHRRSATAAAAADEVEAEPAIRQNTGGLIGPERFIISEPPSVLRRP